jgi:biopolymer transport protein ExbD
MAHAQVHDDDGIHGINVTPLVDIMLVLLIIFMVATQLDKPNTIGVSLPRAATATEAPISSLSIVITKDGGLRLDGRDATLADIEATARRGTAEAVVSADRGVAYERVIGVVDAVRKGGVSKLALSAELEDQK